MSINLSSIRTKIARTPGQLLRFRIAVFLTVLAIVYAYLIWQINILSNVGPDPSVLSAQSSSSQPHIDQATISKIKQLQDNSVNVQTLFNQARQNPFQE
ncbi:MAG TPA: hypothetical protein VNG90_03075 [Candidatus Acidoferrum sp.]|nr:hypothetical protein [Candidatus Acidoferrum sp.]